MIIKNILSIHFSFFLYIYTLNLSTIIIYTYLKMVYYIIYKINGKIVFINFLKKVIGITNLFLKVCML